MPRIGHHRTAHAAMDAYCNPHSPMADGWRRLGEGAFRVAMLHIASNVVYKVESGHTGEYGNEQESRTAALLRKIVWERVRIPATTLYKTPDGPVLAMEHVEGTIGSLSDPLKHQSARREMFDKGRLTDMHGENFFFDTDGMLVPVDMAAPIHGNDPWSEVDERVMHAGNGCV